MRLTKPLVVFDLETTGISFYSDRIVQMAFVKLKPDGAVTEWCTLVNPGMPIPAAATAIHGITDEMVADAPRFRDVARKVAGGIAGCDLAGFNAVRFDWPMLRAHLDRVGVEVEEPVIVDAMRIFHRFAPRNLQAAVETYCGRRLDGAHNALADAKATLEVLQAQVRAHAGELPDTPEAIAAWLERKAA